MFTRLMRMNDAYERLLIAAKKLKNLDGPAAVARFLNESEQLLNNWKRRGIPRAEIMDIADKIGCDCHWLRDGTGTMTGIYQTEGMKDALAAIEKNPGLIRLLKVAAPLGKYQIDVAVQTSTALAQQQNEPPKGNGTK